MSVYSVHAASLQAVYDELGTDGPTFTWSNKKWQILPGGTKFKRENSIGGLQLENDLQLTCLSAQFGNTLPDSGDAFTYLNQTFRVVTVTTAPAGYQIRITSDLVEKGM